MSSSSSVQFLVWSPWLPAATNVEQVALGARSIGGEVMTTDSIFRVASLTKPITAVATLILVDDQVITLDDPVGELLPELAQPDGARGADRAG